MIQLRLREIAESKNVNKSQLSLRAQVGLGVVRRYWDSDTTSVDLRVLDMLCAALECQPCDLMYRTETTTTTAPTQQ